MKFIKTVKDAIAGLGQQGEADARDIAGIEQSRKYATNLKIFIEQVRKEFNGENLLFIYETVIPIAASCFTGCELVKKAQIAVFENSNSELSVKNTLLIPADGLQMLCNDYQTPVPKDDVHLGTYGILTLRVTCSINSVPL